MVYEQLIRLAEVLLKRARAQLDSETVGGEDADPSDWFAKACIARSADLIDGLLALYKAGKWPVARVLGRTLIEFWLYGQYFILSGQDAVEKLFAEDSRNQGTLEFGRKVIWERLESQRDGGIDLRIGYQEPGDSKRPNLEELSTVVQQLRDQNGFGRGIPIVQYQISYRHYSNFDVHPSFDLLGRYFRVESEKSAVVVEVPEVPRNESVSVTVNSDFRNDLELFGDLLCIYLRKTGKFGEEEDLKAALVVAVNLGGEDI